MELYRESCERKLQEANCNAEIGSDIFRYAGILKQSVEIEVNPVQAAPL